MTRKTGKPPDLHRAPLSYQNPAFINSPDGRLVRIISEYSEPLARFRRERIQDTIVFFGSARFREHADASRELELLDKPGSAMPAPRKSSRQPMRRSPGEQLPISNGGAPRQAWRWRAITKTPASWRPW